MANKKLSISQLKKDAKAGILRAELTYWKGEEIIPRLKGIRPVVGSNSVAIFFLNADGNKSELPIPKSALVDYTEDELCIYYPGYREPNAEEKKVLDEWAAIESSAEYHERATTDCLTDGSSTYWKKVAFFKKKGMEYLMGHEKQRGLKLDCNRRNAGEPCFIRDEDVRGDLEMRYVLYRTAQKGE